MATDTLRVMNASTGGRLREINTSMGGRLW